MNSVVANNPLSGAWELICALTDAPEDELRESYGVARPLLGGPGSVRERHLRVRGNLLVVRLEAEEGEISASVLNDAVPAGRMPKQRRFIVEGAKDNPLLVEQGGCPMAVNQVLDDLISWSGGAHRRTAQRH
jgi:hypothetical protein